MNVHLTGKMQLISRLRDASNGINRGRKYFENESRALIFFGFKFNFSYISFSYDGERDSTAMAII